MPKARSRARGTKPQEGMRAIDIIRAAHRNRRRSIVIPEFNNLELFFGPLTSADLIAVDERMRDTDGKDPEKNEQLRRIYLLIHKAELEDGSRAFQFGDAHYLLTEADYVVLQRIIGFMYAAAVDLKSVEDAKKE